MIAEQLQTALVEADPIKDRAFREEAENYFDLLVSWLKRQKSMDKYRHDKYTRKGANGSSTVWSFKVPSTALRMGKYPKFAVILTPFRTGTAKFGRRGDERVIIMPILHGGALEGDVLLMTATLGDVREIFIHEFVHYLDDLRYKKQFKKGTARLEKQSKKAYYNSAVEFNAYFQGGASDIEKYAAKMGPGEFVKKFWSPRTGFKKFRKEFENLINKKFRRALEGKWKKKYEVRLWQLYRDMLERDGG